MAKSIVETINMGTLTRYQHSIKGSSSRGQRVSAVRKFLTYLNKEQKKVTEIDYAEVEVFLEEELNRGEDEVRIKKERTTITNYYSFLKAYFKFLETTENVMIDFSKVNITRVKNTVFKTFTDEEVKEIFSIINAENTDDIKIGNSIFYQILFYTGCSLGEVIDIFVYQTSDDLREEESGNYILLDKKILHFDCPTREFILYDKLIDTIKQYHQIRLEKEGRQKPRAKEDLFWTLYNKSFHAISRGGFETRMKNIKGRSSFANKKLSSINIRYTVIKKLLEVYSVDEVSEIVGIDISKVQMFVNTDTRISISNKYFKQHPFSENLI